VQTKQKSMQKQSYKTHPVLPEMEATVLFLLPKVNKHNFYSPTV